MEEENNDTGSETDEEWEGIDEEISLSMQTLCLFCKEIFNCVELMFDHCKVQHMFDIVSFSKKIGLDCINYIKFINYIRHNKISSSEMAEVTNLTWASDDYMKPFETSDPLLTFDIESYISEKLKERSDIDDTITISQSRFESLMQALSNKDMKLQNALDRIDRMKEAAKTVLLCNNQECSSMNNRSSLNDANHSSANEDDNYYFSTYDHFAIHHEMLQDKVRTEAYLEAILENHAIFQGKRVLDVGCGTAILSMFAAKAGASYVIGVDKSDVIFQAMDIVRENGFDNVIELFKGRVEDMPPPEQRLDIIVSEWMGYFLLFEGMVESVIYARDNFLKPGGYIFPNRCTLSLLAVCDMEKYKEYVQFWDDVYGFKMTAMKKDVIKEANVETVKSDTACSEAVVVKALDLTECQSNDTEFSSSFDLTMLRSCSVTALVGYFDCFFDQNIPHKVVLSTSPNLPSTHWKQTMFLLQNPIAVSQGQIINCRISCRKNRRDPRSLIVKIMFGQCCNSYYLS